MKTPNGIGKKRFLSRLMEEHNMKIINRIKAWWKEQTMLLPGNTMVLSKEEFEQYINTHEPINRPKLKLTPGSILMLQGEYSDTDFSELPLKPGSIIMLQENKDTAE